MAAEESREVSTIRLLWRHREEQPRRRGPRPARSLDDLVRAGIELADSDGLAGLTVRRLADRLDLSRMSVYSYVRDLDQLTELMIDTVQAEPFDGAPRFPYGSRSRPPADRANGWRRPARLVADTNLDLLRRHPWLIEWPSDRPVLGPNSTRKYDRELAVFDRLGLTDHQLDLCLWLLLGHVRTTAAQLQVVGSADSSGDWWQESAAAAAARITAAEFPLAVRVGAAAGEVQQTAFDPLLNYRFGLDRLLDGIQLLITD